MKKCLIAVALLAVLPGGRAFGETYRWVDERGIIHFTDNPENIPAKYLKRVQQLPSVTGMPQAPPPSAPETAAEPAAPARPAELRYGGMTESEWREKFTSLRQEMKALEDGLPAKRDELNALHRIWVISMGRLPTGKELQDFAKKQEEGATTVEDNPYVNKNPLSSPGRNREAYYKKLAEVQKDEARIKELQAQLAALDLEASRAGVPFPWRR